MGGQGFEKPSDFVSGKVLWLVRHDARTSRCSSTGRVPHYTGGQRAPAPHNAAQARDTLLPYGNGWLGGRLGWMRYIFAGEGGGSLGGVGGWRCGLGVDGPAVPYLLELRRGGARGCGDGRGVDGWVRGDRC